MNFKCKELTITDEPDFGCTVQFSDTKDKGYVENMTVEEALKQSGKYLSIQRSYQEDIDEDDYYSIETSESDIELSHLDKIYINIHNDKINIYWSGNSLDIGLQLLENEIQHLKKILKKRFREKIIVTEN